MKTSKSIIMFVCGMITASVLGYVTLAKQITPRILPGESFFEPGTDSCSCDNSRRYNVNHPQESQNIAVKDLSEAKMMVAAYSTANPGKIKGVWISKETIDKIFCNNMDANGIYIYNALMGKDGITQTMLVQGAHTDKVSTENSDATMFYSLSTCPFDCGIQ